MHSRRLAANAKATDERVDQVGQLSRTLHLDLVIALETNAAGARESSSKRRDGFGWEVRIAPAADTQRWHRQRLDSLDE